MGAELAALASGHSTMHARTLASTLLYLPKLMILTVSDAPTDLHELMLDISDVSRVSGWLHSQKRAMSAEDSADDINELGDGEADGVRTCSMRHSRLRARAVAESASPGACG